MKDKALEARLTEYLDGTEGLFVVQPLSGPDGMNRINLAAYWWAHNVGYACNETGVRGQHFHVPLDEFVARDSSAVDGRPRRYVMLEDVLPPTRRN